MGLPWNVTLKLDWAAKHVQTLQVAQDKFLAGDPYTYGRAVEGGTREGEGTDHVFRWERYTRPPDCLGLIAGDAIHNARSALDHLAVALAEHGARVAGVTMTRQDEAGIQFPIVRSHADFVEQVRRGRLQHVDSAARALIESRQPYRASNDPELAHLMRINRLDNADKHRAITPVAHAIEIVNTGWPPDLLSTHPKFPPDAPVPWDRYGEAGTEIFRYTFATPQREMDVPCIVRFGVILFDTPPFYRLSTQIEEWIGTVRLMAEEIADRSLP
jgi:hypothetical protein